MTQIPWSHPTAGIIGPSKFALYQEGDKVILDMVGRRRDLLLSCGQAEKMMEELRRLADLAELEPPELIKGEQWLVRVRSYDGVVAIRFTPPVGCATTRVRIPYYAARKLADQVEFHKQQAAYRMQFLFAHEGYGVWREPRV